MSVSQDYLPYQIWDSIQACASSLTGVLASRAVLNGMGVGDEAATATGAVLNSVLLISYEVILRLFEMVQVW